MSCDTALGMVLQRTIAIAGVENNEKASESLSHSSFSD
jgi:hypothetical protein